MSDHKTILSLDRKYRYTLWREWDIDLLTAEGFVMFIGLNPSTADETKDDPTIRRCIGFAKAWGYGAICMTNLFALRATDPEVIRLEPNPAGEHNQHYLLSCAATASMVVAAWGTMGDHRHQDLTVRQWISEINVKLYHLGLTKHGHPKHPLCLKADTKPIEWLQ